MIKIISFVSVLFLIGCVLGNAQNPYIRHLTTYDGLPSNTVYQIYQDHEKFMWLTTDAGVVRYDGTNFINYRKKDGLSSNEIIRMREDHNGRIWLFNYNAFTNFYYKGSIYNEKIAPFLNAMIGKGFIIDMYHFKNKLYFYNLQCELFVLDSNNVVYKKKLFKNEPKLPLKWNNRESVRVCYTEMLNNSNLRVWSNYGIYEIRDIDSLAIPINISLKFESVFPIKGNKYLVKTTNSGIFLVDEKLKFSKLNLKFDVSSIRSMIMDHKGLIWISSYTDGVFCFNGNELHYKIDVKKALGVFEDFDHNIWISSQNNGVHILRYELISNIHYDNSCIGVQMPQTLSPSFFDGVWCANGEALSLLAKKRIYKADLNDISIRSDIIYNFPNGQLLLATKNACFTIVHKLLMIPSKSKVSFKDVRKYDIPIKDYSVSEESKEVITMFDQNRLISLNINDFKQLKVNYISERINNAFFDKKRNLIINGRENLYFDGNHLYTSVDFEKFNGCIITDYVRISESSDIVLVDGEKIYIRVGTKIIDLLQNFQSAYLSHIRKVIYYNGSLFFSTNSYVYRVKDPLKLSEGNHGIEPISIKFNSINDILFYKDTLYVATNDGLSLLSSDYIDAYNSNAPRPYLKNVIVNYSDSLGYQNSIGLVGDNTLRFLIGKVDNSFSPIIFLYTLVGYDKSWNVIECDQLEINYQNLPRGEYVLKVKARKSNSDWSEPLEIPIIIKPTFYEYPVFWFLLSSALLITMSILYMKIKNIRVKKAQASHQMIVLEQKALLSMMNPHFIFNSLGSIQNFLMKNKAGESILYLTQFSRLIRQNLNAVKLTMINLDEEVERLNNYLELEQIRLEAKFDYYIEVDPVLEEDVYNIPSMMIQPFVENAIWHGISNISYKGVVSFKVYRNSEHLIKIVIEDNGPGISEQVDAKATSESHLNMGMNMTKKRLDLLSKKFQVHSRLDVSNASSSPDCPGTKVTLYLPYILGVMAFQNDDNQEYVDAKDFKLKNRK